MVGLLAGVSVAGLAVASHVAAASVPQPVSAAAFNDAGVLAYGDAPFHGSPTNTWLNAPVVAMAATPTGKGYWLVAADGGVFAYGDAGYYGSAGAINLYAPIVGMAPTPSGHGYWLVALDGGIFAFGDAGFYGSTGHIHLNRPVVGMAATPSGHGYWLVALDGGIFAFGDAGFHGSTGKIKLASPIVGMAATKTGKGYWLAAGDGGIFSFGDAGFYGSLGGRGISGWVAAIATTPDTKGYWLANANGAVYHFGDAAFHGNNLLAPKAEPVTGIVSSKTGLGYWLLEPDAFPTAYRHPGGGGTIVSIATRQIRANPSSGYFCNPYGPCEQWCALFATWAWRSAGIPIPSLAFVGDIYTWAGAHTALRAPTDRAHPGDLVLYGTGPWNVDTAVHTGVVAQAWPDGAIDTVEGDAGPGSGGSYAVVMNGPYLPSSSNDYNGFPIFAFAVP